MSVYPSRPLFVAYRRRTVFRSSCVLLAGLTLMSGGCVSYIAQSGKDLGSLSTREEVRNEFGTPTSSSISTDSFDAPYDEFVTRRKIVDPDPVNGMPAGLSLWLSEVAEFPGELLRNERRVVFGQTLRFEYDNEGNVRSASCEKRSYLDLYPVQKPATTTADTTQTILRTESRPLVIDIHPETP
jgi:hypothetical protein